MNVARRPACPHHHKPEEDVTERLLARLAQLILKSLSDLLNTMIII